MKNKLNRLVMQKRIFIQNLIINYRTGLKYFEGEYM